MRVSHASRRATKLALFCTFALALCAWMQPSARADEKLSEAGSAAVSSLDELQKLSKSLGIDLPPFLTAQGIEQQFAFLGQNGLETGRPIGVVLFVKDGWDLEKGQGFVFVLPAKPEAAPLTTFINAGGKPVEGHADSVSLNGVVFRRTAEDLIFSPTGEAATAVDPAKLVDQFKATVPGRMPPVARLVVNVDAMRTGQPEQFKAFINNIRQSSPAKDDAERLGQDLVINFVQNLNRVDLTLGENQKNLVVRLGVSPANVPAPGQFQKPGLPSDIVTRVDIATSPLKLVPSLDTFLNQFAKAIPMDNGQPAGAGDRQKIADVLHEGADVLLGGQAVSVGVESHGKEPVVYLVQQQAAPDLDGRIKKFVDDFNALSDKLDKPEDRSSLKIDHYTDAGDLQVSRLTMTNKGKPQGHLDVAQKDQNVYISVSEDSEHHLSAIAGAPQAGEMRGLVRGEVKLEQALAAAKAAPDSGLANMPPDQFRKIEDLVKGQTLRFGADGQGDAIVFSVGLPEDLVKQFIELMQQSGGGAAK